MAGRKTLFEPVAEKLIAQIREGRIAPGEKMPSEYELCTHYALSRSSIRKALDCLEQKGLIRRQPGIGTFVCGNEPVMKKPVVIAMPELPPFSYAFSVTAAIQKVVSEQNSRLVTINPKQLNENDRFPFDAFAFIDVGGLSKERLQELARRGFPCIAINRIWKEVSCFSIDFYVEVNRWRNRKSLLCTLIRDRSSREKSWFLQGNACQGNSSKLQSLTTGVCRTFTGMQS